MRFSPFTRQSPLLTRNSRTAFLSALLVSVPLFGGLAGCGGGGGGGGAGSPAPAVPVVQAPAPTPAAPAPPQSTPAPAPDVTNPPPAPFVPNYSTELTAVRRWNKSAVTVRFIPPPADSSGNVRNVAPLVQQAVDLWNRKVGQGVQLQMVNENANADITIRWTAFTDLPPNAIGQTEVSFRTADQILSSAKVRIEESLPDNFQVQVIAHEIGHSLGIDGHSANPEDLMYANAHLPAQVTARDQNTILKSYMDGRGISQRRSDAADSPVAGGEETTTIVLYECGSQHSHSDASPAH